MAAKWWEVEALFTYSNGQTGCVLRCTRYGYKAAQEQLKDYREWCRVKGHKITLENIRPAKTTTDEKGA